ncbi:MAG: lysyl-tRNA synthetase [Dermatophilaceae bacterium]
MWDAIFPYLAAIIPTLGMLAIAYVVFKNVFEADRKERLAMSQWEAAQHPDEVANAADSGGRNSDEPQTPEKP